MHQQQQVGHLPRAEGLFTPRIVPTACNAQHPAHHRDLKLLSVIGDELIFHRWLRVKPVLSLSKGWPTPFSRYRAPAAPPLTLAPVSGRTLHPALSGLSGNACWRPSCSSCLRQVYKYPRPSPNSRSNWLSLLSLVRASSSVFNLNSLLYFFWVFFTIFLRLVVHSFFFMSTKPGKV